MDETQVDIDLQKEAAPAWVRAVRAGKLSPEALQRITGALPEGVVRQIRPLGRGMAQQADLMAGNIGGQQGLVVRKLPSAVTDLARESSHLQQASNIIEERFPGIAAKYLPANPAKGIFQEYGTKEVVPGWDKIKPTLSRGQLTNPMSASPEFKKVYEPLVRGGVQDVHGLNVGPKGQLIDYQYQLPRDESGIGWTAGMASYGPKITPHSQGLLGHITLPHKLPTQAYGTAQNMTPANARAYEARVADIKSKIDAARTKGFEQIRQAYRSPQGEEKLTQNAIRKHWLGKGQPVKADEYYTITPSRQELGQAVPHVVPPQPPPPPVTNGGMLNRFSKFLPSFITNRIKKAALQEDVQLQPHQQRIIDRMSAGDKRLLLYHGLGSGKSLSSLAAAEAAGGEYGAVTPASLRQNYEKEIEKFTEGTEPDVLSYSGVGAGKQFKKPVKTTIFDEAHRLRNPGTAAAQAAKRLAQNSENLLLLTGTPITNHPSDLASLLGLLHNKNISPEQFEKQFVGYKKVYPSFLSRFTGKGVGEQPYVKNEAKLRELLKGKIDYQPSKTPEGVNVKEEVVKVPLSTDQQRIQKAIKSGIPPEWSWKLNKEFPLTRDELKSLNSFLTGLRQSSLSTLPFRGDKKPLTAFEESGKLQQALKDLKAELGSDPRKKAITYSNYIDAGLSPYAAALEREKIPYGMFHGGIPLKQRKQTLQDYNEGKLRALLLGPAAAEGISTKGTNLIQLLDPHWHESRSSQARGRGLRFDSHAGLPEDLKNVAVKRYISESKEPSWLGRLLGSQRQRTGDEILQTLAADKEKLNDVFRKILQEEGTPVKAAAESVAYTLQNLVFGCLGLALQFKHCHWNVRGTMFKPLHDFLDEVHETLEDTSDDLAERLVTLDHPADGNPASVAAAPGYKGLPLKFMQPATIVDDLTDRLKSLCDDFNAAIKATDSDPVTSNMLQDMTHKLEKHLWMLRSQKEKADTAEKEAATAALSKLLGRSWLTVR